MVTERQPRVAGSEGARCVSCHMPTRTYMVVDARRDHRIAVPRPDLSDALGTPNASAPLADYQRWLARDSDRADALVTLANVQRTTGELDAARASLEAALRRDETSLLAHLSLADHQRAVHDDAKAESLLRHAAELYPESADVHFALGLLLVREKHAALGVLELERATDLAPANSHYAYVLAVGLHSTQQVDRALATLRTAAQRFPENAEIRSALRAYGGP